MTAVAAGVSIVISYVLAQSKDQISLKTIHDTEVVLKRVGEFKDIMYGKKWDDMDIKNITEVENDDFGFSKKVK